MFSHYIEPLAGVRPLREKGDKMDDVTERRCEPLQLVWERHGQQLCNREAQRGGSKSRKSGRCGVGEESKGDSMRCLLVRKVKACP